MLRNFLVQTTDRNSTLPRLFHRCPLTRKPVWSAKRSPIPWNSALRLDVVLQEGLDQQRHTGFLILLVNAVVLVAIAGGCGVGVSTA